MEFWMTIATALTVLLSSFCVGLLEILSDPQRANYPSARLHVRVAMIIWTTFLAYRGLEMLLLAVKPSPQYVTVGTSCAALALLLVQAALLENQLRCRLPASTQRRIQHMLDVAACRRRDGTVVVKGLSTRINK